MHSHFISALAFAGSASALVLPRQDDGCCFEIKATGGESGTLGQLGDGQNRVGGDHPSGSYCIKDGGITDGKGRGCILTPPTTQFQCDEGATPTTGFSVSGEGEIQYNGNTKFYACGADKDEYNIYTKPVEGQKDCVEITLSSSEGGKCSGNGGDESSVSSSAPASSEAASTAPASKQSSAPAESAASMPSASSPAGYSSAPSESGANSKPSMPAGTAPASSAPAPSAPAPAPSAPAPSAPAPSAPAPSAPAPAPSAPANSAPSNEGPSCEACKPVTVTVTETAQGSCAPGASAPPGGVAPPAESAGSPAPSAAVPGQSGGASQPAGYSPSGSPSGPAETQPAAAPSSGGSAPPAESAGSPAPSGVVPVQSGGASQPSGYSPGSSAPPAETQPAVATETTGASSKAVNEGSSAPYPTGSSNKPSSAPAGTGVASEATSSKPMSAPAGTGAASETASSQKASGTSGGSACQTSLSGAYQTPHLIVPVSSEQPDEVYGTNYNGQINSTTSTIFNFDIPQDYEGKKCSIIFLFPKKEDLETSDYEFGGSGSLGCSELSDAASEKTSYSSVPSVESDLGTIDLQPGNSYVVATQDCKAGTTQSIELSSKDGLELNFFEDWNPSPLGLYITSC